MLGERLENVRKNTPLVHNITNYVTVNDVANVILATGASPIMSDDIEDVEDITTICGALNINIGTLNQRTIPGMFKAGKKAKELGHPVILDPVGAGASRLRTETAIKIADEIKPDVIRGNISEIKTLWTGEGSTKGVDADIADRVTDENLAETVDAIKALAKERSCVIAVTGAIDIVADADKAYIIRNGVAEMGQITGTGCQLSGMTAAYVAANLDNHLEAVAAAVASMGLAGEKAKNAGEIMYSRTGVQEGNSTMRNRIIDAICNMTGKELEKGAKYEII